MRSSERSSIREHSSNKKKNFKNEDFELDEDLKIDLLI